MEPIIVGDKGLKPYVVREPYIKAIFSRLDNMLPYNTGFSVSQIDVDPVYTQARSYLNKIVSSKSHFHDVVACCNNILLKIITADEQKSIDLMKTNSINSVYIILSLLFSFLTKINLSEIMEYPSTSILRSAGMASAPRFYNKIQYMSKSSNKLESGLMRSLLSLIGHLKSDQESLLTLKRECEIQVHLDPGRCSHLMLDELKLLRRILDDSPTPNSEVLSKIDDHLTEILMYISLNNNEIFLDYFNTIFKRLNVESLYIRRMSILKTAHLTKDNFSNYLNLYKHLFHVTKRPSQQALLMYYFAQCITSWATYRTNDFYYASIDPNISVSTEALFDFIYKQFDGKTYTKTHYQILSCLLYFQPKQLEKFLEEKNSKTTGQLIKRSMGKINPVSTTNSKQKFLSEFVNLIHKSPESADSFTKFLLTGCAIETLDKSHLLVKFLHSQFEHLCIELQMNKPEYTMHPNTLANLNINSGGSESNTSSPVSGSNRPTSPIQPGNNSNTINQVVENGQVSAKVLFEKLIEKLRVHAFAILCMVDPLDMIDRTIRIFGSLDSSFAMLATLSGGIKLLISVPLLSKKFFPYLQNATPVLTRYLRIAATRLSSQQKLEMSSVNTMEFSNDQTTSTSQDVSSKAMDDMGAWAGPSSVSSSSASGISRHNSHLKTPSQGSLAGKVKNVLKVHSTSVPVINERPSDPSSFAASMNSKLGTLSHHSSFANDDNASSRSYDSWTSADNDEPRLFRIQDELSETITTPFVPKSKLKLRMTPFTAKEIQLQHKIIINIMDTYLAFSFLCYADVADYPNSDFPKFESHFKRLIDPIATLLVDSDKCLVESVKRFLLSFCQSVSNQVVLRVFVAYIGTSILVDSVAKVCLSPDVRDSERDDIIKYILQLLETRSENSNLRLMFENKHIIESVHAAGTCGRIIKNFERCIFLGLFSNNLDTIRISRRLLSFWIFVVTNPHHHANCLDKANLPLAKSIAADKMTASSLAIKKKLRDHLCQLTEPTEVLLDVWSLMFEKLSLLHGYSDMPQNVNVNKLQNYMTPYLPGESISVYGEYMASMGGLIMSPEFRNDIRQPFLQNRLELFLHYKMLNLFNSDVKQRENCREIICVSVHPYLCGLIIDLVSKYVPKFEESLNSREYNICEIFLSVLRALCAVDFNALFPHAIALWKINYQILKMMNISDNDLSFLRLKLKFCKLEVLFLSKLEELAMNGNISKKNEYARVAADYLESSFNFDKETENESKALFSWSENSGKKVSNKLQELKKSELRDLHLDIKVETSMMLKLIFYKLPLDTPKNAGKDNPSASSVIFSNYFNLFVRLLERLNEEDSGEQPLATQHRYTNIIRDIIQSLINLLVSNPDIGLKYALPLGYHNDNLIRVSFINVFSSIVRELRSSYYKKDISLIYKGVLDVLVDEPLLLATAGACPKAEIDTFANALLEVNEDETNQLRIIMCLIRFDIINTTEKNELMRSNTVGTRLVSLYSGIKAADYLIGLYKPIFEELLTTQEYFEVEKVDKMTEIEKQVNTTNFLKYFKKITDTICNSINEMPAGLKLISKTIFDVTSEKLYESRYIALSSYLFLRLFNPAIVAPERIGLTKSSDLRFKRSLIQLARTLQVIVNEKPIKFSLIEDQNEAFDDVKKQIWNFMHNVVSINIETEMHNLNKNETTTSSIRTIDPSNDNTKNSGLYFHSYFYDHWMEIREEYSTNSGRTVPIAERVKLVSDIDATIGSLGLPKRIKEFIIPEYIREDKSERGLLLYDFLSQSAFTEVNADFVKVLVTKDGMPLIVINTLDIDEDCTVKVLAYAILQTLIKYWELPYCVLWDLTSFTNIDLFKDTFSFFEDICTTKYLANFKRVYMVNISPLFFEGFKTMAFGTYIATPEYYFINSDDDIKTLNKYGLINYVNSVSNDARVSFRDVSLYQVLGNRFVPVKLKVGNHFVQINSGMPKQIKIGSKMHIVHLVDFYRIKYLEDINASAFTGVSNEISMIDTRSQSRVIISSSKKIEIMRTLYYSRARLNNDEYQVEDEDKIGFSPTLSIGELLNISFTGLLSPHDNIRNSAYGLLASISSTMNMNAGRTIDYVNGVIFPYGDSDFISSVSSNFAKRYPEYTYAFLSGFFQAFDNASISNRDFVVLYVSPWIKNIYKHVYLSDIVRGHARTAHLIRKIVRISKAVENRQAFALFIWPQLSIEDNLIDITIDEIVAASIDHEAEGNSWHDITRHWPLRPTIKICHVLIKRLKDKSYETKNNESEIETHTRWVETTVLVKFLAYLIFDSLLFVERYISDIFFIVTIYMDFGPLELRRSLLKLLNRTFHSYLSKPQLSRESHRIIEKNIELMNSARFKLLFGLTREDIDQPYSSTRKITGTELVNKSHSISSLCEIFTSFLKDFSDIEEFELQVIRWQSYVMKITFNNDLQFQARAILVFGSLSKQGMSGNIVCKVLKLVEESSSLFLLAPEDERENNLKLCICTLHSFGKSVEGVIDESIFHPLVFWISYALMFVENINFVQYASKYLKTTFKKMNSYLEDKDISVFDYLFEKRVIFKPFLEEFEKKFGVYATPENFDSMLMALFGKALESPFSMNEVHKTIKLFMKYRYRESKKFPDRYGADSYCQYLFFVYILATSNEEMVATLEECGMSDIKLITGIKGILIPEASIKYPSTRSLSFYSGCDVATKYFKNQKIDEIISSRVVALYLEAFKYDSLALLSVFANNEILLLKFLNETSTSTLMEYVLDLLTMMMALPEYSVQREKPTNTPIHGGLEGIVNLRFTAKDPLNESTYVVSKEIIKSRYKLVLELIFKVNEAYSSEIL